MSKGEQKFYVYVSDDSVISVVRFYERRTGKRAQKGSEGMYAIAVRGEMPFPALGLTVQPNTMYGGSAKSVITITRQEAAAKQQEGAAPTDTAAPEAPPDTNRLGSSHYPALGGSGTSRRRTVATISPMVTGR
jgi:hypothetical protein